jgi:aldehyde:ferredoxin oxidoreductase
MHVVDPSGPTTPEELKKMTKKYQKNIKNSPIWDEMVRQYGKEKAEELLKEFQLKPG